MESTKFHQLAVKIRATDNRATAAQLKVYSFSSGVRLWRIVWRGALGLLLTLLSVAIPIVHFVSVPLGLLITLLIAGSTWRQQQLIESGQGSCPYCGATVRIFPRTLRLPFEDVCESCQRRVIVSAH